MSMGTTFTVSTNADSTAEVPAGSLREGMLNAFFSSVTPYIIHISQPLPTITLVDHLPVWSCYTKSNMYMTIDGGEGLGNVIDGNDVSQAFMCMVTSNDGVAQNGTLNATLQNLTIRNCVSVGGDGLNGGGGGMGAGGAFFCRQVCNTYSEKCAN